MFSHLIASFSYFHIYLTHTIHPPFPGLLGKNPHLLIEQFLQNMLKFCYQGAAMNTFLLSDFFLLDIKENWIESFHLWDEESKVIEDEEKEGRKRNRDQFTQPQLQWTGILTAPITGNYWSHYCRNSWESTRQHQGCKNELTKYLHSPAKNLYAKRNPNTDLLETAFIHLFQRKKNFVSKLWARENNKALLLGLQRRSWSYATSKRKPFLRD